MPHTLPPEPSANRHRRLEQPRGYGATLGGGADLRSTGAKTAERRWGSGGAFPPFGRTNRGELAIPNAITIDTPSPASATCLLADLAALGRAEMIENGDGRCRVWVDSAACGGTDLVLEIVEDWLRTCSLPATEVRTGGTSYTVTAGK